MQTKFSSAELSASAEEGPRGTPIGHEYCDNVRMAFGFSLIGARVAERRDSTCVQSPSFENAGKSGLCYQEVLHDLDTVCACGERGGGIMR